MIVEVETLEGLGIEEEVNFRKYFARVCPIHHGEGSLVKIFLEGGKGNNCAAIVGKGRETETVLLILMSVYSQSTVHSFRSYCVFIN